MGILESVIGSLLGGSTSEGRREWVASCPACSVAADKVQEAASATSSRSSSRRVSATSPNPGSATAHNQPVSPQQLQNVFGDQVPGMASQAGLSQGDFLSQLSQHLPNAVDGMTPNGNLPSDGSMSV